jgi:DNA-binding YbaB/EbfC family protein
MLDMMKMMGKVKEVQARLKEAQDNLHKIVVTAEAGAGMVKATVNGKKQIMAIDIDPSILTGADKVLIQDLVVAAVNRALDEDGLLPNIPGFDLSQMMG